MSSDISEDPFKFAYLIEDFASIKEKYGDNYPIILYEPAIRCQEKKFLRDLILRNRSIRLFDKFEEVLKFVKSLSIGFIFVISESFDEQIVLRNFRGLEDALGRSMFDFEEEIFLKDLFGGTPEELIKSLKLKAYVFNSSLDFRLEASANENEEDVMVMCDIKEMAKGFRQEYVVIWYDPGASPENQEILTKEFDLETKNIYTNFQELLNRISNQNDVPYHLIMTGKLEAEKVINEINLKDSLLCLYIYSDDPDLAKMKKRKVLIEKTLESLAPKLKQGIRENSKLVNSFPAFATDFDASDRNDVYNLHYYLKGLINFNNQKQAKEDFLHLAKTIYESKKLLQFEKEYYDYKKTDILRWYTIESPVYKLVNNCLRLANSNSILYCRYILRDLERAIKEEYKEKSHEYNGVVFRGAYISKDEWEKLQRNVGKEIEMYGFLSTSQDLNVAKNFVYKNFQNKILISIIIPPLPAPELNEQGFANLSQNSDFPEAEILFNVRSKFQILEAGTFKIDNEGKECRHLVLLYGAQLLRKHMTDEKPSLKIDLELPLDLECSSCKAKKNLFGFRKNTVEVCCLKCLQTKSFPEDTPLYALDNESERKIAKTFNGTILKFDEKTEMPFYGYQCQDCQGISKERYFTWINKNGDVKKQCSECFGKMKSIESSVLICESSPYAFWREYQAKWETIHSDYQQKLSKNFEEKDSLVQSDVYMEVQRFDLCIEYEKKNIQKLNRKRKGELEKIRSFGHLAKAYEKLRRNKEALNYFQKVFKINQRIFGQYDQKTLTSLQNLAFAYDSAREYRKAKEYSAKVLEIMLSLKEQDKSNLAIAYNNLASVCKTLGEPQQALEYNLKALEIIKAVDGEKHPNTAMSYHNIASVYEDVGAFPKALEYYQEAFNIRESVYGEKHFVTASSYNNLGAIHQKMGEEKEALDDFMKAVRILISIYGEKHSQIAISYNNLGLIYRGLRDYKKAGDYHMKALDIAKAVYEDNENEISATSYSGLGTICTDLGQHPEAKVYFVKALEIIKSVFGEKNQKTALSYTNLGWAHLDLCEYSEAKELFLKALEITKSMYGENHPSNFVSYNSLAGVYGDLEDHEKALQCAIKALDIAKSIYGERNLTTALALNNVGFRYCEFKKFKEAREFFEKALAIRKSLLGEEHFEVASIYDNLGSIEKNLGNTQKAREYFTKALNIKRLHVPEDDLTIAQSYVWFATLSKDLGQYKEALGYYEKALTIRKSLLKEGHALIISSYDDIASTFENLGEKKKALEYYLKNLDLKRRLCGEKHSETANGYIQVASLEPDKNTALNYEIKAQKIRESLHGKDHPLTIESNSRVKSALKALQAQKKK